ncbi:orotidine-5'-phosphate decarboxylase [Telmatospirillum siberiense]|uniref:Orotidine 5'-phosphate decarboxylase n=1 Tax=Telmatospirillum siberiense TaxID=382514 RepID=A0A2N3PSN1_9PROT|nr:orotidine-5'-phosphate decarboxylase [Telmatospirillum siberiense]PKU23410.1 orotidine-5'-phosphate decarboxylase [Telmatospirillum siberiense]
MTRNPVFCALDTTDPQAALALSRRLAGLVGGLKLGLEFFSANGPEGVRAVSDGGLPLFLDLKFHDIPNTVAGAVRGAVRLGPQMATLHACGGREMMKAAVDAAADAATKWGVARPQLLAVTVLTSMSQDDLAQSGVTGPLVDQVRRLAALAQEAGVDGVVCSPHEVDVLRAQCGPEFRLVIPGIRPAWAAANDQKRVLTPAEALAKGADWLVIGRPITAAADPAEAARRIQDELAGAIS